MGEARREALAGPGGVFLLIKPGSSCDTSAGASMFLDRRVMAGKAGPEERLVLALILTCPSRSHWCSRATPSHEG